MANSRLIASVAWRPPLNRGDRCNVQQGKMELPVKLYGDWRKYAEANGEDPGNQIAFGKKLKRRGIENKSSNGIRAYRGVELIQASPPYDAD